MLLYGIGIYLVLCLIVFCFQRSLLYFPSRDRESSILTEWIHEGETIGFCREVDAPAVVWLMTHGNAGQAASREYVLGHIASNSSLFVLEYPGYGSRTGSPSQQSINAAAMQAYEALRRRFPNTPVCLVGESIGSGPASVLASMNPAPEKIVLITPFDSLYRVAAKRFFVLPVWLLLLDRWDNVDALRDYQGQLEIYGARQDEVIPVSHARRLSESYPEAKFILIEGGHNDWSLQPELEITFYNEASSD